MWWYQGSVITTRWYSAKGPSWLHIQQYQGSPPYWTVQENRGMIRRMSTLRVVHATFGDKDQVVEYVSHRYWL